MSELWDCYDKNFNIVEGKALVRGQEAAFSADEYHLVCDIAVRHADGTYLLILRNVLKENYWKKQGLQQVRCVKLEELL